MSMKYSRTYPKNTGKPVKIIYGEYIPTQAERREHARYLLADIAEFPEEWDIEDVRYALDRALFKPWRKPIGYAVLDI